MSLDAFWLKNTTIVSSAQTRANTSSKDKFGKGVLATTKWCETTQNMSFGPNVVDWMRFGRETRKMLRWPELVPKRHPRNRLRNGALAANKWCETTQNVSFGPKVVDWMCFGQKTRQ